MVEIIATMWAVFAIGPVGTGLWARSYGKSFWLWTLIGCLLPGLSFFLLYFCTSDEPEEKAPVVPLQAEADANVVPLQRRSS